jgi:hypothetical protein
MTITVFPEVFSLVKFDAERISVLASDVASAAGFSTSDEIMIDVNETTPLQQVRIMSMNPIRLSVESGAFDDPHRPRELGDKAVRTALAIPLFRAFDRTQPGFVDAPTEQQLSHEQLAAWEVAVAGRIARTGLPSPRQRRLYAFRVRHGFTDTADTVFSSLWSEPSIGWSDIVRACEQTAQARLTSSAGSS